jgi:hypothetical protein
VQSCAASDCCEKERLKGVADPHLLDADADPDPACHFDADPKPDPTFHFDADREPDPSFQIKAQTLEKVLQHAHIP